MKAKKAVPAVPLISRAMGICDDNGINPAIPVPAKATAIWKNPTKAEAAPAARGYGAMAPAMPLGKVMPMPVR